jgi:hypothetical protein
VIRTVVQFRKLRVATRVTVDLNHRKVVSNGSLQQWYKPFRRPAELVRSARTELIWDQIDVAPDKTESEVAVAPPTEQDCSCLEAVTG